MNNDYLGKEAAASKLLNKYELFFSNMRKNMPNKYFSIYMATQSHDLIIGYELYQQKIDKIRERLVDSYFWLESNHKEKDFSRLLYNLKVYEKKDYWIKKIREYKTDFAIENQRMRNKILYILNIFDIYKILAEEKIMLSVNFKRHPLLDIMSKRALDRLEENKSFDYLLGYSKALISEFNTSILKEERSAWRRYDKLLRVVKEATFASGSNNAVKYAIISIFGNIYE